MTISSRLHAYVRALAMALPLMLVPLAEANTIDCGIGDVDCLIAAIDQANADPQHKTTIRLAGGTYALTKFDNDTNGPNGLPSIVSTVTIKGGPDGATLTRLAGSPGLRILHVGASGRLTLNGVSLMGGTASSFSGGDVLTVSGGALLNVGGVVTIANSSFEDNSAGLGGAVFNDHGTMTILDSAFIGNFDTGVVSDGGVVDITRTVFETNFGLFGVGAFWSMGADVRITDSRFSGNSSHFAGGVRVSGGTTSIIRTTFADNDGDPTGGISVEDQATVTIRDSSFVENVGLGTGAISNLGGNVDVTNTTFAGNLVSIFGSAAAVLNLGGMTLVNSTFADNAIFTFDGSFQPAIVIAGPATTILQNTIVGFMQDCAGDITSLGNNLIGDPSSCIITLQLSDLTGDADLGAFTDDGTPGNARYPLLPDSQAIDAANDAACTKKDQIGRPRAPRCDIGAVEFRRSDVVTTTQ